MKKIFVPQEDVNSEGVMIVELVKNNFDKVKKNEIIVSVETTKAVFDIVAPNNGIIMYLIKEGDFVPYNHPVAIIARVKKELEDYSKNTRDITSKDQLKTKITKKALQLAQQNNIDITQIETKTIITEKDIIRIINRSVSTKSKQSDIIMKPGVLPKKLNRIMVLGGGFGAMQVIDILLNQPMNQVVGVLDDNSDLKDTKIFGIPVFGSTNGLKKYWGNNSFDKAIISISTNIHVRRDLYDRCKLLKIPMANAICPSVRINRHSFIGEGNVICSFVHIGTCATIGNNNFISSQTNIEHHNVWGSHITTGPNCSTSSRVEVGDSVKFGTGIFIQPGIAIGNNCLISSGSVITRSIPDNHTLKTKLSYDIKPIDKE